MVVFEIFFCMFGTSTHPHIEAKRHRIQKSQLYVISAKVCPRVRILKRKNNDQQDVEYF
jgi:hypothetical protein